MPMCAGSTGHCSFTEGRAGFEPVILLSVKDFVSEVWLSEPVRASGLACFVSKDAILGERNATSARSMTSMRQTFSAPTGGSDMKRSHQNPWPADGQIARQHSSDSWRESHEHQFTGRPARLVWTRRVVKPTPTSTQLGAIKRSAPVSAVSVMAWSVAGGRGR